MPDAGSPEPRGMSNEDRELLRKLRESNYNQKPLYEEKDDEGEINMTPETTQKPESLIRKWGSEVKEEIKNGKAIGVVLSDRNFNVLKTPKGEQYVQPYTKNAGTEEETTLAGMQLGFRRGKTNRETFRQLNRFAMDNHKPHMEIGHLYVTAIEPSSDLSDEYPELASFLGNDKTVLDISYLQKGVGENQPDTEKRIYLAVKSELAGYIISKANKTTDPNEIHDTVADIFTTPQTRKYFDASRVSPINTGKIITKSEVNFEKVSSSTVVAKSIEPESPPAPPNKPPKPPVSEGPATPEGHEKNEPDFIKNVKSLLEGDDPEISDEWIQRQARLVLHSFGRTQEELTRILSEGNKKFSNGEINEEDWEKLAGLIYEERERLKHGREHSEHKETKETSKEASERTNPQEKEKPKEKKQPIENYSQKAREKLYADLMWCSGGPEDYHQRWYSGYYDRLTTAEKLVVDVELQLAQAVNTKRGVYEAKDFGSNRFINGLSKTETRMLYEIEGVKTGLEDYQLYVDKARTNDGSGSIGVRVGVQEKFSILECKDRDEVLQYRQNIEDHIAAELEQQGIDKEKARLMAIRAERNAFNLHYLGNTFEAMDSVWVGDRRVRTPTLAVEELVNVILKGPMKPLDAISDRLLKGKAELKEVGTLFNWGRTQLLLDIKEKGILVDKFEYVQITTDPNKYWRAVNIDGSNTLLVPECYKRQTVGSVWEETTIGGKTLVEYLRNKEEIPWEQPEANKIWVDYATKLSAMATIWDIYTGKMPIQPEKFNQFAGGPAHLAEWSAGFIRKIADLKLGEDWDMLRWFIYASVGVREDKRAPYLRIDKMNRSVLVDVLSKNYIPKQNGKQIVTFPHDSPGILGWAGLN